MTIGIYGIKNKVNGKLYVGSSSNIEQRWIQHRGMLNRSKHPSPHLQSAWNKYGANAFVFYVIEETDNVEMLAEIEQREINRFQSHLRDFGYNIRNIISRAVAKTTGLTPVTGLNRTVKISFDSTEARRRKLKIAAVHSGMNQTELLNYLVDQYCDKLEQTQAS